MMEDWEKELEFYTVEELAEILRKSEGAIRYYLRNGILKGIRVGREWRIKKKDFRDFMKKVGEDTAREIAERKK